MKADMVSNEETVLASVEKPAKKISPMKTYMDLFKVRLNAAVVITSGCGYLVAAAAYGLPVDALTLTGVCTGTTLLSFAASVGNQIWEKDLDAQMARTKNRPLPSGAVSVPKAKGILTALTATGTATLLATTTPATALIGLSTTALYCLIYTPLKQRMVWNTEIGAVVGALPPLMGWYALNPAGHEMMLASFSIAPHFGIPALLFAQLFAWQMQHFTIVQLRNKLDYARAGYKMMVVERGEKSCIGKGLAYTVGLVALPFIPCALGYTTWMLSVFGFAYNAPSLIWMMELYKDPKNRKAAKAVFHWGFFHFIILALFYYDMNSDEQLMFVKKMREIGELCCAYLGFESMFKEEAAKAAVTEDQGKASA